MNPSVNQMIATLSNRVLRFEKANSDRDYSGGGWYEETKYALFYTRTLPFSIFWNPLAAYLAEDFTCPIRTPRNIRAHGMSVKKTKKYASI